MQKIFVLSSFLFVVGFFSCSEKPIPVLKPVSSIHSSQTDSVQPEAISSINSVEALLPELPLLKFPLSLDVDSFRNKKAIPLALNKNLPWFSNSTTFQPGTKIRAAGKFYVNMHLIAAVYFVSFDGEADELPDKEELFLSLYNTETGTIDSRSFAVKGDGISGSSFMKNPEAIKRNLQIETSEIYLTFQSFGIKNDKFVLEKSKEERFPVNEKGRLAAYQHIKNQAK
jgi:hypothetical protein